MSDVPVPGSGVLAYDVVDVFADGPFAGNQLAVVHGAQELREDQLLALTREFGYSETTFPTPTGPTTYAVRIFTPGGEIPFAGHPTLGTAWVLRERGDAVGETLVQTCGTGDVGVRFDAAAGVGTVELTATPRDLVGPVPAADLTPVLADLGLAPDVLTGEAWLAGAGLSFLYVPVTEAAVVAARPARTPVDELLATPGITDRLEGINLVSVVPGDPVAVHARVFVPGLSVSEDPATGSAAICTGMALAASGLLADGGRYEIRQGIEMGRPSRLHGRVDASSGVPARVHVAGRVFGVMRGTVDVPDA